LGRRAGSRQQAAESKQQAAESRQQAAGSRQHAARSTQQAAGRQADRQIGEQAIWLASWQADRLFKTRRAGSRQTGNLAG
jgi:hypothetical protein